MWPADKTLKQFVKSTAIGLIEDNLEMFYGQLEEEIDNILATLEQCEKELQMAMDTMASLLDDFVAESRIDEAFVRLVNTFFVH